MRISKAATDGYREVQIVCAEPCSDCECSVYFDDTDGNALIAVPIQMEERDNVVARFYVAAAAMGRCRVIISQTDGFDATREFDLVDPFVSDN